MLAGVDLDGLHGLKVSRMVRQFREEAHFDCAEQYFGRPEA